MRWYSEVHGKGSKWAKERHVFLSSSIHWDTYQIQKETVRTFNVQCDHAEKHQDEKVAEIFKLTYDSGNLKMSLAFLSMGMGVHQAPGFYLVSQAYL